MVQINMTKIPLRCRLGFHRMELVDKDYETDTAFIHRLFPMCERCLYVGFCVEWTSTHKFTGKVVKVI